MSVIASLFRRRSAPVLVAGAAGLIAAAFGLAPQAAGSPTLAPLLHSKATSKVVADKYIVVLKAGAGQVSLATSQVVAKSAGGTVGYVYDRALQGFSVTATAVQLDRIRALPDVDYVAPVVVMSADTIQVGPPKGLDRTSERFLGLDNRYTYSHNGTNVHAYVVDTGIRSTHVQLSPRVLGGFTSIIDANGTSDCNGHGTHVAGTIGGTTYGIAKNVFLHPVRVLDCTGTGDSSTVIAGVNWVLANAVFPAVMNMSIGGPADPATDAAVNAAITAGITVAVAAGNDTIDACTQSPADVPDAITVGSVNPVNDTVSSFSNFGPCLDLYGPGEGILSAYYTSNTAAAIGSGTSQATPHVSGVAALYLQTHPAASPATVRAAIMYAADDATTVGWPGIVSLPALSPNVLLHWGSVNDGHDDGDPHLQTVDGINYDFQSAGEFTLLRDGKQEIQTRQTAVETTSSPITNPYTGLTSCVSLNTAFAASLNGHRVTFEPNISGIPDPSGLQLRIDGALTVLGAGGANLGPGGHVSNYGSGGIQVDFPDGTTSIVTSNWWPTESRWYLNVAVYHTAMSEGIAGSLAVGSWLPALPGGASMGPIPGSLHQRYLDLNTTYANAWRVTNASSLFDYLPGTSTATFTFPSWPGEKAPCRLEGGNGKVHEPLPLADAQKACRAIVNKDRNLGCVSDVMVTGEPGFARAHQVSEQIDVGSTRTLVDDPQPTTERGKPAKFRVTVGRNVTANDNPIPVGAVQIFVDGKEASGSIKLDQNGQATITVTNIEPGQREITAAFVPAKDSSYLSSLSVPVNHTVR